MVRPRWRRVLAAVLGLWFAVSVTGWTTRVCPEHGWTAGVTATTDGHQHAMHHTQGPAHSHNEQHHHDCTCPGDCCCSALQSMRGARLVAIPVVPIAVVAAASRPVAGAAPRRAPDLRLQLPLGPPSHAV